jgi:histidinol-phosphatase
MSDTPRLDEILEFAVEAAQLAGAYTLGFFQTGAPHELKADRTPVTQADRGAEQRLRERIAARFPAHGIVGEEFGVTAARTADGRAVEGPRKGVGRWILDPVDGTHSFVCGVPLYATLIAFEWDHEIVAGVIHLPALHETVYAARGLGCWWNGRPARVSDISTLSDARLANTGTKGLVQNGREAPFRRLRDAVHSDRGWSDAYAYALVATGRIELAIDPVMQLWDVAPMYPIIEEAGGTITTWDGRRDPYANEALASNGRVHSAAIRALAGG